MKVPPPLQMELMFNFKLDALPALVCVASGPQHRHSEAGAYGPLFIRYTQPGPSIIAYYYLVLTRNSVLFPFVICKVKFKDNINLHYR